MGSSLFTFSRAYKKYVGIAPREYKKREEQSRKASGSLTENS